ncbi:glycosyltransferase family 4 protein, partial [Nocardioides sp.]
RAALVSAVAVVVPSQWEEAFGLVAVEAMAAGIPPIAPAHGAFVELVTDGVDGVLFAPGRADRLADVLAAVHESPDRFLSLGEAALSTYLARFTPDRSLERLEEIYRYAVANPRGVERSARRLAPWGVPPP